MEALLLVLFYALSWYLKNRQQKSIHKKIESDPDWDLNDDKDKALTESSWIEKFIENTNESLKETLLSDFETQNNTLEYNNEVDFEDSVNNTESKIKPVFESKPKEIKKESKREAYSKNKYPKARRLINKIYKSSYIKDGIILKEILDKPIALRNKRLG